MKPAFQSKSRNPFLRLNPAMATLTFAVLGVGISSMHAAILGTPGATQVEYTLGESGADFVTNFQDASGNSRNMTGGTGAESTWTSGAIAAAGSTASLMVADGKAKYTMSNAAGISADYQVTIFVSASDDWPSAGIGGSPQTLFSMEGISFTRQGGNYSGVVDGNTLGSFNAGAGWHNVGLMFQKVGDVFSFWTSTDGGASWIQQGTDLAAPGFGDDWGSTHLFIKPGGGESYYGYADAFSVRSATVPPPGGDLTWNNGTSNFIWSTSDNNWTGFPWTNASICNAIFGATGAGTVTLGEPIQLGNMTVTAPGYSFTGSTLSFNSSVVTTSQPVTIGSALAGNGLTKQGAGTLTLNGAIGYSGLTTVGQGSLELGSGGSLGPVTLEAGANLTAAANAAALTITGNLIMNDGATLAATGTPNATFGNVFFSNNNQQVIVTGDNQSTISAEFHLAESHTFQVADGLADTDLHVSGIVSNHEGSAWGAVVKTGDGTLRLSNGANGHEGNYLAGGTLVFSNGSLGNPGGPSSLARFTGPATLRWDTGNTQDISTGGELVINDGITATLDTNGNDITLASPLGVGGSASGGLEKTGAGTLTLGGVNTYTGNTTVSAGALELADDAQLKFVVSDGTSNTLTGTGAATLKGDFLIDTTAVTGTVGGIWTLVDRASLTGESFSDTTFTVIGFVDTDNDGIWTMTDAKGDWSFSEATGNLTLDVGTDYDSWKTDNGVTGGENDDDDNDGLTNHEEYAFGLDPTGGSSVNPIAVPFSKTSGKFSYTRRDTSLPDPVLNYTIWYSTDLATWIEDTMATQGTPALSGEVETVEVTVSPALLSNPKLFIQVRAN